MSPEEKFALMLTAMIGNDDWVALVEDEIAREDAIEQLFGAVEADEPWPLQPNEHMMYEDAIENDYEWIRGGC